MVLSIPCYTLAPLKLKPMKAKFYFSSVIVAFVICLNHLNAQTNVCPAPTGLTATNVAATSATLAWNSVAGAVVYNVRYRTSPSPTGTWQTVTTQTNNVNLTNLLPQTTYEWQVQSGCPNGNGAITLSPFSPSSFFTTLSSSNTCPIPTGLFANNITSTSATLHWNSTGATSYVVRYRAVGTTAWTKKFPTANQKNITGLTPATAYQWQVRSKCVTPAGTIIFSAWSALSTFQTLGSPTTCLAPTGLTASTSTPNGVLLAWNSTGASSYNIRYRQLNTAAWTNTTSSTNSKAISGLLGGTTYQWQVQSVCTANGAIILSAWSALASFTTNSPVVISPNPADNKISVTHECDAQEINLIIRDFFGSAYLSERKRVTAGLNQYEINTSSLKNGIYYLEVNAKEGRQTLKFYIQH